MQLPNPERASIPARKLRDYLLDPLHRDGGPKARFFRRLGFTRRNWPELERALREQHLMLDAKEVAPNDWGRRFIIAGRIEGPTGVSGDVQSVWIILYGEDFPRLLTAYPT